LIDWLAGWLAGWLVWLRTRLSKSLQSKKLTIVEKNATEGDFENTLK